MAPHLNISALLLLGSGLFTTYTLLESAHKVYYHYSTLKRAVAAYQPHRELENPLQDSKIEEEKEGKKQQKERGNEYPLVRMEHKLPCPCSYCFIGRKKDEDRSGNEDSDDEEGDILWMKPAKKGEEYGRRRTI
jgi:hypothetical protein